MIWENSPIKEINIHNEEHKIVRFADDTQMMSEGDAISLEQSVSTYINLVESLAWPWTLVKLKQSGLEVKGSPWLNTYPIYIKINWNPPRFKILGVWLTADWTDCEEINYNNKFSEMEILFNIWIKRMKNAKAPLGKIANCFIDATAKSTWWIYW